ncbi:DNA-binding transcriptional regulator, MerR family [Promicromonospora umidemergens]|uniref:HTH merR-type domain-containing protein n=1 Tax=Promicromonospora umidemergens TaxID=629679 RepID=A0ABP8XN23_9MICO|nr:MerR family transcriptional regulator [Promicromonospora umidemergens]MCP2282072.1 DNA-binding transcriptional regulator, MerR family [Promicromonospora umidemergens]
MTSSVLRDHMTVGELSGRTGVSVKNLRQYTDWGLIYSVGRSATGYRLFDDEALWCVELIGLLRGLGLTIAEIRDLTHTLTHPPHQGQGAGTLLAQRLRQSRARIEDRISELQQTLARIDAYESDHLAELTGQSEACWARGPRPCQDCA